MDRFGRNYMIRGSLISVLLWALLAGPSQATVYEIPADGTSVVGTDTHMTAVYQDTLLDIARRNSLGYYEIIRANPSVDMWLPGAGTDIMLPGRRILPPGPREGIVVNLPEHRLYYYPKPKKGEKPVVITYPVSIGKMDWKTPLGETHVIQKEKHPNWYPPEGVRKEHLANGDPLPAVVKAGPDNPLGDYAMRLAAGGGTYLIHGTNNPMAVGMAITHGCVRMYPEDVAALFPLIPVGTKVWLINEPVKVAFVDGELLMEAHPPVDEEGQNTSEPDLNLLSQKLDQALGNTTAAIHWDFAKQALQAANGIPTVVGLQADLDTGPAADPAAAPPPSAPAAAAPSANASSPAATRTTGAPAAPSVDAASPGTTHSTDALAAAATESTHPASEVSAAPSPPVTVTLGSPKVGPPADTASAAASPTAATATPDPQPSGTNSPVTRDAAAPARTAATSSPQP
jgi:L,D-transpeptidase ErfK/SrfK